MFKNHGTWPLFTLAWRIKLFACYKIPECNGQITHGRLDRATKLIPKWSLVPPGPTAPIAPPAIMMINQRFHYHWEKDWQNEESKKLFLVSKQKDRSWDRKGSGNRSRNKTRWGSGHSPRQVQPTRRLSEPGIASKGAKTKSALWYEKPIIFDMIILPKIQVKT